MSSHYKISFGIWARILFFETVFILLLSMSVKGFTGFIIGFIFVFLNAVVSVCVLPVISLLVLPCKKLPYSINATMGWFVALAFPFYFFSAGLVSIFMGTKFFTLLPIKAWNSFAYAVVLAILLSVVFAVMWTKDRFIKFREESAIGEPVER